MRALTIRQPWASFIVAGLKRIENRTWRIDPQRVAVHAGKINAEGELEAPPALRSVVVGTVQVVECHRVGSESCWERECPGHHYADMTEFHTGGQAHRRRMYHWVLAAPREFAAPIRAAGKLGLWIPDPDLQAAIQRADDEAIRRL
jgi:hypothetical protein